MIQPCEENERGAHSGNNLTCGHTREKKKRTVKPTTEICMQERHDRSGSDRGNTANRAAWKNKIISYTGDPDDGQAREEEKCLGRTETLTRERKCFQSKRTV